MCVCVELTDRLQMSTNIREDRKGRRRGDRQGESEGEGVREVEVECCATT